MGMITWAQNPWGLDVPIHAAWFLLWVSFFAGLTFLFVHAVWSRCRAGSDDVSESSPPGLASCVPGKVLRHSLQARLFHWIMAGSMLILLASAFLPRAGWHFSWVTLHWCAGIVLVLSILFHIVHVVFFADFGSIWLGRRDLAGLRQRVEHSLGTSGPPPEKPGKYAPGNKLYHLAAMTLALCAVVTGVLMMSRVRTPFFTRNPYLFDDLTWGVVYLVHGFAGMGLIALVIVHVYFALRPENLPILTAMAVGTMDREYYLKHHDPGEWACNVQSPK